MTTRVVIGYFCPSVFRILTPLKYKVRHRRSRLSEAKESLNLRKFPYSNEAYSRFSQITYRLVTTFFLLSSAVKELLLRVQAMAQAERRAILV